MFDQRGRTPIFACAARAHRVDQAPGCRPAGSVTASAGALVIALAGQRPSGRSRPGGREVTVARHAALRPLPGRPLDRARPTRPTLDPPPPAVPDGSPRRALLSTPAALSLLAFYTSARSARARSAALLLRSQSECCSRRQPRRPGPPTPPVETPLPPRSSQPRHPRIPPRQPDRDSACPLTPGPPPPPRGPAQGGQPRAALRIHPYQPNGTWAGLLPEPGHSGRSIRGHRQVNNRCGRGTGSVIPLAGVGPIRAQT